MGTKLAPCTADLYMSWFESQFVYTYSLQPLIWKKNLDKCFMIWIHGEEGQNKLSHT